MHKKYNFDSTSAFRTACCLYTHNLSSPNNLDPYIHTCHTTHATNYAAILGSSKNPLAEYK